MTRWLLGVGRLVLMGVIWSAATHPRAAFSDVEVIVLSAAQQHSLEDLVPLVVKGISEEYGDLHFQHQAVPFVQSHLFGVESNEKLHWERVIRGQKSDKPGVQLLTKRSGHNRIQTEGNIGWILDLKINSDVIGHLLGKMLPPFEYVQPLAGASLLDFDLPFKVFRLPTYLSILPQQDADSAQGNQNPNNREPQIGTVKRILLGIVGILFLCLTCWLLYRAAIADSICGFFGRMFLVGTFLLVTTVCLDSALFDPRIWLLLVH